MSKLTRKSPRPHLVRPHSRRNAQVRSYMRGSGDILQRKKVVVKSNRSPRQQYEQIVDISAFKNPQYLKFLPKDLWDTELKSEKQIGLSALRYIDPTYIDTSYYENMLKKKAQFLSDTGRLIEIKMMTPREYFRESSDVNLTYGRGLPDPDRTIRLLDKFKVDDFISRMESGERFAIPLLDYVLKAQEGNHRVRALQQIGVTQIPVLVVTQADSAQRGPRKWLDYAGGERNPEYDRWAKTVDEGKEIPSMPKVEQIQMQETEVLEPVSNVEQIQTTAKPVQLKEVKTDIISEEEIV